MTDKVDKIIKERGFKYWHEVYQNLKPAAKEIVDDAYMTVRKELTMSDMVAALDDRAEQLVAAITRYMIESNKPDPLKA